MQPIANKIEVILLDEVEVRGVKCQKGTKVWVSHGAAGNLIRAAKARRVPVEVPPPEAAASEPHEEPEPVVEVEIKAVDNAAEAATRSARRTRRHKKSR